MNPSPQVPVPVDAETIPFDSVFKHPIILALLALGMSIGVVYGIGLL